MSQRDRMRKRIEKATVEIAAMVKPAIVERFGKDVGFTLFLFTFGEHGDRGSMAYASNSQRADMIKLVKEWLAYQEAGLYTEPAGGRGEVPS